MKPDWAKLLKEYKDSASVVIADVDCTAGGKYLCSDIGVQGYLTIKLKTLTIWKITKAVGT